MTELAEVKSMTGKEYLALRDKIANPRPFVLTERALIERLHPHTYSKNNRNYDWLRRSKEGFVFDGISVDGIVYDNVELSAELLDDGHYRDHGSWLWSRQDDWKIPTAKLLFKLLDRLYDLRQDPKYCGLVQEAERLLKRHFAGSPIITATVMYFNEKTLEGKVVESNSLTPESETSLIVPVYWPLVLVPTQPVWETLDPIEIQNESRLVLDALLGENARLDVLRQFSSYEDVNNYTVLRDVMLWTPRLNNRYKFLPNGVSLGGQGYLNLNAKAANSGRALGVRRAREN